MKHRIFIAYFLLLAIVISVSQFLGTSIGAGTIARLATIESLVERGTPAIAGSSLPPTPDRVLIDGRFYGGQLPFLQYAAAPLYGALKGIFGLSLSSNLRLVYALLTIGTVGVLSSLMVAFFFDLMFVFGLTERSALQAAAALGLGTLVLPYSTVFNQHIIAGVLIFFALRLLFRPGLSRPLPMGLLIGASLVIDPVPGGAFCAALLFFFTCSAARRRLLLPFLAGVLVPVVVHCFISIRNFGTALPVNIYPAYFRYPGSIFDEASLSGVASHASFMSFLEYCYHAVVGRRGLFSYNPVLIFPCVMLLWCTFSRRGRGVRRAESFVILSASAATILCYLLKTVNYGGWAFGMRFFVPLIPAVAVYLGPFLAKRRRLLIRALFVLSLYFSTIVSLIGAMGPWTDMYIGPNPIVNNFLMAFGNIGVRPPPILPALAMSTNEGDAGSLYHLGRKFNLYGWKEHARDAFFMAVRADQNNPAVRISLGNVLYDLGDISAALEHYIFQISNHPEYVSGAVGYNVGRGLCVARVAEEDIIARRNVVRLLAAEGRAAEARDFLQDYLERGEERFRERCRRTYPEGEIEVVHPASRDDLLLLLEHLEQR